jgi:hypothetical protein
LHREHPDTRFCALCRIRVNVYSTRSDAIPNFSLAFRRNELRRRMAPRPSVMRATTVKVGASVSGGSLHAGHLG